MSTSRTWGMIHTNSIIQKTTLLRWTSLQLILNPIVFIFSNDIVVALLLHTGIHIIWDNRSIYGWEVNFPLEELLYYRSNPPTLMRKFPEDIQCIVEPISGCGGIYISNIQAAQNPQTLKRLGIGAVVTAIKGKNLDKQIPSHIEYLYVPAVDHESFDLSYYFEQVNEFIHEQRKRTNVLAHCMAGISRSVTLVIAYLMKFNNKSFDQAYQFVKSRRKIIHPNDSFIAQLKKYGQSLPKALAISKIKVSKSQNCSPIKSQLCNKIAKQNKTVYENKSYDQRLKENIKSLFANQHKQNTRLSSFWS